MEKAEIIAQLRRDIMPAHSLDLIPCPSLNDELWFIRDAFPGQQFPLGCLHEFVAKNAEEIAATRGFIHVLVSHLLKENNTAVWINSQDDHFPPALSRFNVSPNQLLFIKHQQQKELWWVVEEFLKYKPLTVLIAELDMLDFTASRRFQLAVERSGLTAFIIRTGVNGKNNNTVNARWQLSTLPSLNMDGLPGIGFPSWKVELIKMRHGKTASHDVVWNYGKLLLRSQFNEISLRPAKKMAG